MYEQIINSVIDFSILIMEGFLAFYLLAEMWPTTAIDPVTPVEAEDIIEIIAPTLVEAQTPEIVEVAPQSLNLSVKELMLIAKQHNVAGYARMRKGKLQKVLLELGLGFGAEIAV